MKQRPCRRRTCTHNRAALYVAMAHLRRVANGGAPISRQDAAIIVGMADIVKSMKWDPNRLMELDTEQRGRFVAYFNSDLKHC